ncbi:hypothetical protein N752_13300 [Desulforamulus aquiferis]|nr:hypothetical protein [Desulforamulus aquiferis]RYD04344.1 hypothetical protein N752_13300 [Desulforamulus aquiferis]
MSSIPDFPLESWEKSVTLYHPRGCMRCSNTGYRGRVGVYELLFISENIQRLALQKASTKDIKKVAVAEGMITLREDGLDKAKQGITSLEEVMRVIL